MWKETNNTLTATFEFISFTEAFAFMTEVAFESERQGHHPKWVNVYNRVEIILNTHDAGNVITEKDHYLAEAISDIYAKYAEE